MSGRSGRKNKGSRLVKRSEHTSSVEDGLHHWDLIVTILLDGVVLLVSIAVRGALLLALEYLVPPGTENWSIRVLSVVSDVGIVAAAVLMTAFDLLKRVVIISRSLRRSFSE